MKAIVIPGMSLVAISVAMTGAFGAVQYSVTDSGIPFGGVASLASGINNVGEISGIYRDSCDVAHASYWPNKNSPSGPISNDKIIRS